MGDSKLTNETTISFNSYPYLFQKPSLLPEY